MKSTVDRQSKYCVYRIEEENLLAAVAPKLKADMVLLNNEGFRNIILDLSSVKYIDSSGLSAVLIGYRLCRDLKGNFVITGLNEAVMKLIKISQLDSILKILPTLSESIDLVMLDEMEREMKNL